MSLSAALLAVALSWPAPVTPRGHEPEPRDEYEERLETITASIAAHSKTPEEAALVLRTFYEESRLDRLIHAGEVHPVWDQDKGRARCLGQVHRSKKVPEWDTLAGIDAEATERCVLATLRVLRSATWMCMRGNVLTAPDVERILAQYARGSVSCAPTQSSTKRARLWAKDVRAVWREMSRARAETRRAER